MIINRELDYALRILRNLNETTLVSATELESREHIPVAFVRKIVNKLSRNGLICVVRGAKGGYRLNQSLNQVTIWSVSQALGDTIYMNECLEPEYQCTGSQGRNCGIHKECMRIQQCLEKEMKRNTLSELF